MLGLTRRDVLHPAKTGTVHTGRAKRLYEIPSPTDTVLSRRHRGLLATVQAEPKINRAPFWISLRGELGLSPSEVVQGIDVTKPARSGPVGTVEPLNHKLMVCRVNLILSDADVGHGDCRAAVVQHLANHFDGHAAAVHQPSTGFSH